MYLTAVIFSIFAAGAVILSGRGGRACDARVTGVALLVLLLFPVLAFLPKWEVLPAAEGGIASSPSLLPVIGFAVTFLLCARLGLSAMRLSQWLRESRCVGEVMVRGRKVELRTLDGLSGPCATHTMRN